MLDVQASFTSAALADDDLLFRSLNLYEELGRLPEYRLELLRLSPKKTNTDGKDVLPSSKLLGKEATVAIKINNERSRYIHGVVTHFERGGALGSYDIYRVDLRPWLWQLTLGSDCRVFQDKTVVEILDEVFAEYGSAGSVTKRLSGSFEKRAYTVQYRESDFNFVARLMEDEGIYYYFKHEESQYHLVLCNGANGHDAAGDKTLTWFEKIQKGEALHNTIAVWSRAHTLQSLKYASTDFAAEAPATDLAADAVWTPPAAYPKPNDLEVFDYPGGHDDIAMAGAGSKVKIGKDRARIEVDRYESAHSIATGYTQNRGLSVGQTFTFSKHADEGEYLVTSTVADMEFSGYESNAGNVSALYTCRFNAVPKDVPFQPKAEADVPFVHGPQTATVMGPSGDEIHTDKYGRVKVRFHWDRVARKSNLLEKSSCWVRVSHPWASKQFGMIALPRVGDEVVVEFLEGNPDRPLLTGRVYNGVNMPPWELPAQATVSGIKTQSSKGGGLTNANELRFDDKKGSEYVWFQAEKDHHHLIKNDAYKTVRNDLWTDVTKNTAHKIGENLTVTVGKVANIKIDSDTQLKIGSDLIAAIGNQFGMKVTGKIDMKGDAAMALAVGAGLDIDAGAGLNMTAAAALHIKGMGIVIDGGTMLTIKAGPSFIILGPDGVTIQGPLVKINCGGSAGPATPAAKAAPATPKAPGEPKENKDPLAK